MNQTETTLPSKFLAGILIYIVSCIVLYGTLTYVIANMNYIINRDPVLYWDRSFELKSVIIEHGFFEWAKRIVLSLGDHHTFVPSLVPSLIFYILSDDSLPVYGGTLVAFYYAPIPVIGAFIISKFRPERTTMEIAATGIAVLAAMYPFPALLLPSAPDFGGNVFTSLALLVAAGALARLQTATEPPKRRGVVLSLIALAACLFVATLFRRWYAFPAAGLIVSFSAAYLLLSARRGRTFLVSGFTSLVIAGLSFCVVLSPLLATKIKSVTRSGVFNGALDAWRVDYFQTFQQFGYSELLSFLSLAVLALLTHRSILRGFLVSAIGGISLGVVLFLYLQAPGIHHFSQIWVLVLASVCVLVDRIFTIRWSAQRSVAVTACIVAFAATVVVAEFPTKGRVDRNILAYHRLADKLVTMELKARRYCVIGSKDVHYSIVENLWQIEGGKRGVIPTGYRVPEVDMGFAAHFAGEPLRRTTIFCDWFITMEKLGMNRQPKFHRIIRYLHTQLFDPTSLLGQSYTIDEKFEAGFGNPIVFFKRKPGAVIDPDAIKDDYLAWLAKDQLALP